MVVSRLRLCAAYLRGMHRFLIKIPFWVPWIFPRYIWRMPAREKVLYLTFDDGPHPEITAFVLDQLQQYGAKATFFCIGKNVLAHPQTYRRILAEGHAVGNHTHSHPNGLHTDDASYLANIREAARHIRSPLFRPPYGRIRRSEARGIAAAMQQPEAKIIMWDVLSADFDRSITAERCLQNVLRHATQGSVVVFHDSEKAAPHMQYALPKVLAYFHGQGYVFLPIRL